MLPYLTIHLCNWVIRYLNPKKYKMYIMDSTDIGAPYFYTHTKFKHKSMRSAFKHLATIPKTEHIPLLKLTGGMRKALSKLNVKFNTDNQYINYVMDNNV